MLPRQLRLILRSGGRFLRSRSLRAPYPLRRGNRYLEVRSPGPGVACAYCEVYIDDFYGLRRLPRRFAPATVVDIGANVGIFSCLARLEFPVARIIAYEPNPEAFDQLTANTRTCTIELHRAAVARQTGVARFEPGPDSTLGRLAQDGGIEVTTIGTERLADGGPIDLLKLDCEGGEWEILQDQALLGRTRFVVMEYHLVPGRTWEDLRQLFAAGGHRILRSCAKGPENGFLASERVG